VGAASSTVRLITVPGTHWHVMIGPGSANQPSRGKDYILTAAKNGRDLTAVAGMNDPVQEGDLATVLADSIGPEGAGLTIGRVVQVGPDPMDALRRQVVVRPEEALAFLSRVAVIVPRGEQAARPNP
jgi:hypothetical protein